MEKKESNLCCQEQHASEKDFMQSPSVESVSKPIAGLEPISVENFKKNNKMETKEIIMNEIESCMSELTDVQETQESNYLPPLPTLEELQERERNAEALNESSLSMDDEKLKREDILKRLEPLRITSKTEVEEDKPIIWKIESEDERVPLFPIRYVHMITAKPKRGKSTLVRLIIGLVLLTKRLFGFESESSKPEKVVLIDTEHSKHDTKKIIEKIANQVGVSYELIDEYVYIHHAQSQSRDELMQSLKDLLFAWGPKLVILDGCAQFVSSFNDEVECDTFVQNLRNLSEQYNASIIAVLHTTKQPDNELPKGHLGSFLFQFGCTIVLCEKVKDSNLFKAKDYSSRHAPFSEFSFYIDKKGLICDASEIVANLEKEEKERKLREKQEILRKKSETLKAWAKSTLSNYGGTMAKKDFFEALSLQLKKQSKNCYGEYKSLVADKIIFETPMKMVELPSKSE